MNAAVLHPTIRIHHERVTMPNAQTDKARVRERAFGLRLRMEQFDHDDDIHYGFSQLIICCIPDLAAADAWLDEWEESVKQQQSPEGGIVAMQLVEPDDQREHSNGGEGTAPGA